MTEREEDILRVARSVIRDFSNGWTEHELQEPPRVICEKLSGLLKEIYNFDLGKVVGRV